MLEAKAFEVRDCGTHIPCIGVLVSPCYPCQCATEAQRSERYVLRRSGYPENEVNVLFQRADGHGLSLCAPHEWPTNRGRTMQVAHQYVLDHWHDLTSGDVICVETICHERETPKLSERLTSKYDI